MLKQIGKACAVAAGFFLGYRACKKVFGNQVTGCIIDVASACINLSTVGLYETPSDEPQDKSKTLFRNMDNSLLVGAAGFAIGLSGFMPFSPCAQDELKLSGLMTTVQSLVNFSINMIEINQPITYYIETPGLFSTLKTKITEENQLSYCIEKIIFAVLLFAFVVGLSVHLIEKYRKKKNASNTGN